MAVAQGHQPSRAIENPFIKNDSNVYLPMEMRDPVNPSPFYLAPAQRQAAAPSEHQAPNVQMTHVN